MKHTARIKLDVHLFSQVDETPAASHATMVKAIYDLLKDRETIRMNLNSDTFILHDIMPRESGTTPDEARGRETILSYEAVVSAV